MTSVGVRTLSSVGRSVAAVARGWGQVVWFLVSASVAGAREPGAALRAMQQGFLITSRCAVPVALVVGPVGAMMALQSLTLMRLFGVERQVASLSASVIVRELAPGFACVVVAMQGGAAIAAEIAAMRVAEELDAIEVMGVEPRGLVAGPRIFGAAVAGPMLNTVAIVCGIAGAYAMSVVALGVPHALFIESLPEGIRSADVWLSLAKTVIFGIGLGGICASAGFHCERTTAGVGAAANRAVVHSVVFVLVANYLVNTFIFGLRGGGG